MLPALASGIPVIMVTSFTNFAILKTVLPKIRDNFSAGPLGWEVGRTCWKADLFGSELWASACFLQGPSLPGFPIAWKLQILQLVIPNRLLVA